MSGQYQPYGNAQTSQQYTQNTTQPQQQYQQQWSQYYSSQGYGGYSNTSGTYSSSAATTAASAQQPSASTSSYGSSYPQATTTGGGWHNYTASNTAVQSTAASSTASTAWKGQYPSSASSSYGHVPSSSYTGRAAQPTNDSMDTSADVPTTGQAAATNAYSAQQPSYGSSGYANYKQSSAYGPSSTGYTYAANSAYGSQRGGQSNASGQYAHTGQYSTAAANTRQYGTYASAASRKPSGQYSSTAANSGQSAAQGTSNSGQQWSSSSLYGVGGGASTGTGTGQQQYSGYSSQRGSAGYSANGGGSSARAGYAKPQYTQYGASSSNSTSNVGATPQAGSRWGAREPTPTRTRWGSKEKTTPDKPRNIAALLSPYNSRTGYAGRSAASGTYSSAAAVSGAGGRGASAASASSSASPVHQFWKQNTQMASQRAQQGNVFDSYKQRQQQQQRSSHSQQTRTAGERWGNKAGSDSWSTTANRSRFASGSNGGAAHGQSRGRPSVPASSSSSSYSSSTASATERGKQKALSNKGLLSYVQRALTSSRTPEEKADIERQLKLVVEQVIHDDLIDSVDWESQPLPVAFRSEPIIRARRRWNSTRTEFGGSDHEDAFGKRRKGKKGKKVKKRKKPGLAMSELDEFELRRRERRANRFKDSLHGRKKKNKKNKSYAAYNQAMAAAGAGDVALDWGQLHIIGTCTKLEKRYLRLTSAPDPSTVRPEPVLHKALAMIQDKWRSAPDYHYTCDQMKSIRQDLTVQHVKNTFTVNVYETHARLALEVGDFSEYNQCQTQLWQLYEVPEFRANFDEFASYRVLYYMATNNASAFSSLLVELSPEERQLPAVAFALQLRGWFVHGNYMNFLRRYKDAPHMGSLLAERCLAKVRLRALTTIARAYRPTTVSVDWLHTVLAFDDLQDTIKFLFDCNGVLNEDQTKLVTKESAITAPPEPEEEEDDEQSKAVTHGLL